MPDQTPTPAGSSPTSPPAPPAPYTPRPFQPTQIPGSAGGFSTPAPGGYVDPGASRVSGVKAELLGGGAVSEVVLRNLQARGVNVSPEQASQLVAQFEQQRVAQRMQRQANYNTSAFPGPRYSPGRTAGRAIRRLVTWLIVLAILVAAVLAWHDVPSVHQLVGRYLPVP